MKRLFIRSLSRRTDIQIAKSLDRSSNSRKIRIERRSLEWFLHILDLSRIIFERRKIIIRSRSLFDQNSRRRSRGSVRPSRLQRIISPSEMVQMRSRILISFSGMNIVAVRSTLELKPITSRISTNSSLHEKYEDRRWRKSGLFVTDPLL